MYFSAGSDTTAGPPWWSTIVPNISFLEHSHPFHYNVSNSHEVYSEQWKLFVTISVKLATIVSAMDFGERELGDPSPAAFAAGLAFRGERSVSKEAREAPQQHEVVRS